ncbi:Mrp/NBP35 family ATP-binding protein, partial [Crocinitomicaceae bacterium]|nr:Mrp/NBP35 family ATP-binding protein [Crocinitomicaceae bacterium]
VNERPEMTEIDGQSLIEPILSNGVKILSIGFFTDKENAVVWRGPMASKALLQMFNDAHWGELDFLLIDLPPGTGDIHLSLIQSIPLDGVVIVSTPQEVALADARRGVNMFKMDNVKVPIIGLVENMSWFTPEELPDNKYYIFGRDGAKNLSEGLGVPFLGQIPIVQSLRESGDIGKPAVLQEESLISGVFDELVENFTKQLEAKHKA